MEVAWLFSVYNAPKQYSEDFLRTSNICSTGPLVQVKYETIGLDFDNTTDPATYCNNFQEWNYFSVSSASDFWDSDQEEYNILYCHQTFNTAFT